MGKQDEVIGNESKSKQVNRRTFVKGAATIATVAAAIPLEPLLGGKETVAEASVGDYDSSNRAQASFHYRKTTAVAEQIDVGVQADNGDANAFTDGSGSFTKALLHDALGVTNQNSFQTFRRALSRGTFASFENVRIGTPNGGPNSKFNGPMGSYAFDLEGLDSHATVIPPAPSVTSAQTAAEEVEHYWGAILRDVPFTEYATNPLAAQAAADLNNMSFIRSSANHEIIFPVTPGNLFRGKLATGDGNASGPFISQFLVQPTLYGAQPLSQQFQNFVPGIDFMTSPTEFQLVQNGGDSGRQLAFDSTFRFLRDGRGLAAFTHVDVLYQTYFTAFLILAGIGAPPNPGNPYINSKTQKGFGTLGGPDIAALLGEMATRALKGAWFHKWVKDLRMRPEEYGALVHARLTNSQPAPQSAAHLHPDVLNSAALPIIHAQHGSFLLPQAFPEGCPTHPCYPTGHGTVAGACTTALKFFFDGSQKIRPLLTAAGTDVVVPTTDGLALNAYTGADRDTLDINGELVKVAFNVTTGHGIHAGIHFRSSNFWSVLLGEQIALSVLQDKAKGYTEPFTINITKFDGTTATITNQ